MKKNQRKLALSRETLAALEAPAGRFELAAVVGGAGVDSHTLIKEDCCITKTTH